MITRFPTEVPFVLCIMIGEYVLKGAHNVASRKAQDTHFCDRIKIVGADVGGTATIIVASSRNKFWWRLSIGIRWYGKNQQSPQ